MSGGDSAAGATPYAATPAEGHPAGSGLDRLGPIVVTGATGHLGNVVMRALQRAGAGRVRALVRPGADRRALAGLDVEFVEGDIRDPASLATALAGAQLVFHLAGAVSIASHGLQRLRQVNVEGTRNVLAACRAAGAGRLVYSSSVHAFVGAPPGTRSDETRPVDPLAVRGPYSKSKAEATLLVRQAAREGLDVVVVHPSGIIGPYDFRPSHTGQLLLACVHGKLRAYVDGGYNFVDVRDVAEGLLAAASRGRPGESYLLTGHGVTVIELLRLLEGLSGARAPRLRLPMRLTRGVSFLIPAYYWVTREAPLFTTYSLDTVSSNYCFDCSKAAAELGYTRRPLVETLDDTLRWFRRAGML